MIYLNNEDISVPNLIQKELKGKENANLLEGLINSVEIEKLLALISEHEIIKSTLVGRTTMVLSMLKQVTDRKSFVEKIFKGLTANSSPEIKSKVLSILFDKIGERNPLDSRCFNFFVHKDEFKTFIPDSREFLLSDLIN